MDISKWMCKSIAAIISQKKNLERGPIQRKQVHIIHCHGSVRKDHTGHPGQEIC